MSLREAAQQALEALKMIDNAMPFPVAKHAIKQLSAALAEPEQTFMAEYKFRTYGYYQDADGKMQVGEIPEEMLTVSAERTAQMIEEVTRTEPEQEPVAYVTGAYAGHFTVVPTNPALVLTTGMALYAHPVDDTALLRQALEALEWHIERGAWGQDLEGLTAALRERLGEKA